MSLVVATANLYCLDGEHAFTDLCHSDRTKPANHRRMVVEIFQTAGIDDELLGFRQSLSLPADRQKGVKKRRNEEKFTTFGFNLCIHAFIFRNSDTFVLESFNFTAVVFSLEPGRWNYPKYLYVRASYVHNPSLDSERNTRWKRLDSFGPQPGKTPWQTW